MVDALSHAAVYNITAYDACYLALAQRLSLPLITTDVKLAKIIRDPKLVQLLT
jgi:predicted nucleic acid-binding protein